MAHTKTPSSFVPPDTPSPTQTPYRNRGAGSWKSTPAIPTTQTHWYSRSATMTCQEMGQRKTKSNTVSLRKLPAPLPPVAAVSSSVFPSPFTPPSKLFRSKPSKSEAVISTGDLALLLTCWKFRCSCSPFALRLAAWLQGIGVAGKTKRGEYM